MTRILFCLIPEKGHVNPYIGPAQALLAASHEVAIYSPADISTQLAAAGIDLFVGARRKLDAHRSTELATRIRDAAWLRTWIKTLLVDEAESQIEPLRRLMQAIQPDVVAIDPMMYPAAIAAELEGLPWASVSNSLNPALPATLDSELLRTVAWLAPERQALFARHGMADATFRGCDVLSPHLTIAFTTRELVGDVPGIELVGPSLPRRRRGDEPELSFTPTGPLIYVSFGSQISYQPALFRRVLDAVADRPVQLLASAGDLATSGELGALPPNVLLRPYVPQLAVLQLAAVMLTHGGANSVMEAIAWAVPLLVAPLCNDQFHQTYFIKRTGIGRTLDAEHATAAEIGSALDALLAFGPERLAMIGLSVSYQRDGAATTARLLIELAARSRQARAS